MNLRTMSGSVKLALCVTEVFPVREAQEVSAQGHLICVLDASGSMYSDMDALRATVVKELTRQELKGADTLVSVCSFSSEGDLIRHAVRVPVSKFMEPSSPALAQVMKLSTRGLTCISQGVQFVKEVMGSEPTVAVVMSDGYANDSSPASEKRRCSAIVEALRAYPNLVVNTVSFGRWSDYAFLASIAVTLGGKCLDAPNMKVFGDCVAEGMKSASGKTTPTIVIPAADSSMTVAISKSARKLWAVGPMEELRLSGLRAEDDLRVFRYSKGAGSSVDSREAVAAFALATALRGEVGLAKQALVELRDADLLQKHARALTGSQIKVMVADLESALYDSALNPASEGYGLPNAGEKSVLEVLQLIDSLNHGDVLVDLVELRKVYQNLSVKRFNGGRAEDGSLVPFPYKLSAIGNLARLSSVDINRTSANINIRVVRKAELVEVATKNVVREVMGVLLDDLEQNNNYTLVGDGEVRVPYLPIRVSKRVYRALVEGGILPGSEAYDPEKTYLVDLSKRPTVPYDQQEGQAVTRDILLSAMRLKVLEGLFTALTRQGPSSTYTGEQVAALKAHGLSDKLNFTCQTVDYQPLNDALASGKVDVRSTYEIVFGTAEVSDLGDLYSANEYLDRRFELSVAVPKKNPDAKAKEKATAAHWWEGFKIGTNPYNLKVLGTKVKLNPVDDLTFPIFDGFVFNRESFYATLSSFGFSDALVTRLRRAVSRESTEDDASEVFSEAAAAAKRKLSELFATSMSPMVLSIGATGNLPASAGKALDAAEVKAKYPDYAVPSARSEGFFYELDNGIIMAVSMKKGYFSAPVAGDTEDPE